MPKNKPEIFFQVLDIVRFRPAPTVSDRAEIPPAATRVDWAADGW